MYLYATPPIDYFFGMTPLKQVFESHVSINGLGEEKVDFLHELRDDLDRVYELLAESVFLMAKDCDDWSGDMHYGAYIFAVPVHPDPELGLVWKEQENGNTYICSPVPLPWLSEYEVKNKSSFRWSRNRR